MNESITDERLKYYKDYIREDQKLLGEYEDKLRYETDPRLKKKWLSEIEQQREYLKNHEQAYEELQKHVNLQQISACEKGKKSISHRYEIS